jgi:hypothetical protein
LEDIVMAQGTGDILVMQVGTAEAKVFTDVTEEKCLSILAEQAPDMARALRTTNARLSAIQNEVMADPDRVVEYYLVQAAQAQADEKLNLDLEELEEAEQIRKIDEYHRYSTIGSALLYDGKNFTGKTKFFTVTWPNMGWWPYRFQDKASSAKAWGGNIVFQHSYYRGRRLYLVGIPSVQFPDLSVFGFDNIASSFVSIG